jgi:hypothetical protein
LSPGNPDVTNCALSLTDDRLTWLRQLDAQPQPLQAWLERSPTRRLGLYFESLWQFFLETDPLVELVAHNLPVRTNGRTLGEFDCLYYCYERGRHVHLELAVKYFLGIDESSHTDSSYWQLWWGPNTADRLDLKVNHLMERQIQLGQGEEAKAILCDMGIENPLLEVEIKGYLFRKAGSLLPAPRGHNPQQPIAHWLFQSEAAGFLANLHSTRFAILTRLHWLSRAQAQDNHCLSEADMLAALSDHFAAHTRPLLLAAFDSRGTESERFFVVPDGWPTL